MFKLRNYVTNFHYAPLFTSFSYSTDKSVVESDEKTIEESEKSKQNENELEAETSEVEEETTHENEEVLEEDNTLTPEEYEKLISEYDEVIADLKFKYAMAVAEQENIRRISREEKEKTKKYAVSKISAQMLDISDYMELAVITIDNLLDSVKDEMDEELHKKFKSVFKGITLTQGILESVLVKNDIYRMEDPVGQEFDPKNHEAVSMVTTKNEKEINTISSVVKIGYTLNDRILRASQVVVFSRDTSLDEKVEEDFKEEENEI